MKEYILACVVLCLTFNMTVVADYHGGNDKCVRVLDRNTTGISVDCHVRILDPDGKSITSEVVSELVENLHIECNQLLLFESVVRAQYFQAMPLLDQISISNCKILRIPGNLFEGLRDLKRISLRTRNLDWSPIKNLELSPGAFNGLRELQSLDLAFNNIKAIPAEVFCPLVNLQTLNLTHNRIRIVDRLGFNEGCGSAVQSLDLSHNQIKNLPEDSDIIRLRRMQHLYLQQNNISDISSEAFDGLISLRILNISYNNLQSLPDGVFSTNRELREIHINNNYLMEISQGVFHRLEQLLILDLSTNQLTSSHINEKTFLGLIRLIILNLSHNSLTRIDGKMFKDLFFLQILNLRNNTIGFIEENAFLPLYNLHTLNLAENRLHTIDEHLFNGLFVLSKLTLNNNLLINIDPKAFKNCSDLKELDLSSNQLTEVPQALWELSLLKTLDLGENQISDFKNGSFKNLDQLTGLRLIDNQIGNLSVGMFWDLPGLQVLNLAKNKIQSIERGTFIRNNALEAVRLDGNFIVDINGVFSSLASLLWLNLSENHLVWFDYAFIPANLKWLDIHGNYIEHLGNYYKLQSEIRIKTLDVSHNRILEISAFAIPNSVELLFINNNFLTGVQVNTFIDKVNLTRVDMYSNEIVQMDINSFRLSPVPVNRSLPEFYIGGNPFNCDCKMEWLAVINNMTSLRQYPRVMDLENVMCKVSHPRSVSELPLTSAKSSDFLCSYETHCFALCHCCDFDACDCEMTCPQNCSCYHDPTWNTNVVDCSAQRVIEVPGRIPMDTTDLYLDGNDFKELQNHVFIGKKIMRALFVNGSGIETIQNRTFAGLSALRVLHLESNKLTELNGYEFEHLNQLKELYLQNNRIVAIANLTFENMYSLEILRLDGNKLVEFSVWNLNTNNNMRSLYIGGNRWSCKCDFLQQLTVFMAENSGMIADTGDIFCWNEEGKRPLKTNISLNGTACIDYYAGGSVSDYKYVTSYLPMMVTTLTGFLLVLLGLVIIFIYRDSLRVWMYTSCGVRIFSFAGALDETEKLYDAYVCYSPKDEDFVVQSLAAELENGNTSYHLCLHYRDIPHHCSPFAPNAPLLVEAAEASKRIIVVLSRNFVQTEWSRYEFRQALHQVLKRNMYKLVIIEEGAADQICDSDLRLYLKTGYRIKWGERRFWEKLRYAMPETPNRSHKKRTNYKRNINTYTLDSSVATAPPRTLTYPHKVADEQSCCPESQPPVYEGRANSDHVYSSIDSDYSTMERAQGHRGRDHRHWPPSIHERANSGHAYLV